MEVGVGVEAAMESNILALVALASAVASSLASAGADAGVNNDWARHLATIGSIAVLVMAVFLIPYSYAALRVHEKDERVVATHRDHGQYYGPSLFITTWMTRANLWGMFFVMAIVLLRLAFRYDTVGEAQPQPAWSLAINMFASMILLGLLALPASFLLWVKTQIMNVRYTKRNDNSPPIESTGKGPR